MVLNDRQIQALCEGSETPMITPYLYRQCRAHVVVDNPLQLSSQTKPVISYGQSSFGYDIRLSVDNLRVFNMYEGLPSYLYDSTGRPVQPLGRLDSPACHSPIDPKKFDHNILLSFPALQTIDAITQADNGTFFELPPRAYALGVSVETFHIPVNTLGICYCKSTYARCGLMVNTTPLEPGWRGQLVLELANLTDLPMKVYANEGIAQVVFFEGDVPSVTYADRSGKYQDQRGIVTARV
jgi:dCTP deaminase